MEKAKRARWSKSWLRRRVFGSFWLWFWLRLVRGEDEDFLFEETNGDGDDEEIKAGWRDNRR